MTTFLIILTACLLGSAIDYGLRRFLLRLWRNHTIAAFKLQGWTEVELSLTPLPYLVACWRLYRLAKRLHRRERLRAELRRLVEVSTIKAVSCGFITPNEARERNSAMCWPDSQPWPEWDEFETTWKDAA